MLRETIKGRPGIIVCEKKYVVSRLEKKGGILFDILCVLSAQRSFQRPCPWNALA